MKNMFINIVSVCLLISGGAYADTPPPGTVKAKTWSGDGNTAITQTGGALDVNVKSSSGITTVNQGAAGAQAWLTSVTNSSFPVTGVFWQSVQPVSATALPLPTGAATAAGLTTINATLGSPMQQTGGSVTANAGSGTFLVDGSGHTQPVSGTFWQATQPVSGTFWQSTQPVSAASLPLPTGAATSANQIIPISTNSCSFTATGQFACTMSTAGASALVITPNGTWSGLIGVECTATTVGSTGWELLPVYINTAPGASQYFLSTNDNATVAIGGCARIQLASFSGWSGTANFDLSLTPGIPATLPVISSTPTQFYTTSNMRDGSNNALSSTAGALNVQVANASIPVTGTFWQATQPVSGTFWQSTQPVSIATAPVLVAGSAVIGKVGIDQTTPGTSNGVQVNAALPAGSNVIGHVIVDTAPSTAVTIADGASATLGAKADAKSTATDTTPVTIMQVLKEISAMEQAPASQAVTNAGTFATQATLAAETTKVIGTVNVAASQTIGLSAGSNVIGHVIADSGSTTVVTGTVAATQSGNWNLQYNAINSTGSHTTGNVSTVITLTAPANAIGFILEAKDANTANIRWAVGATATTTSGMQLQPGRDTGYVPAGANVSVVAESGTQEYQVQWVSTH